MIIITDEPHKIADWIEANCEQPSVYTLGRAWVSDELMRGIKMAPTEIALNLTATDQMMFDLMFAGCFVRNPDNDRWYDDTPINRMFIEIQGRNRATYMAFKPF